MVSHIKGAEELLEDGALTIDEAVAWSGVGRTRLYGEMADGNLPFVQKGARRLIPRKALRQLLAESLVSSRCDVLGGE
jgi:excisionase family DNA binding protein